MFLSLTKLYWSILALYITTVILSDLVRSSDQAMKPVQKGSANQGGTCISPSCSGDINDRALCRWRYPVQSRDIHRIPDIVETAECECCSPYLIERSNIKCVLIHAEAQVLRFNGSSWNPVTENRTVGCTPVLMQ